MRKDSRGLPDICREVNTPVSSKAQEFVRHVKLSANALIDVCRGQVDVTKDPELRRWFAMAATRFEEGASLAVKGFTYEGWKPVESIEETEK